MDKKEKPMTPFFKAANQIQSIIALRCIAIIIQIALILFVNIALHYQLPWIPLLTIIVLEVVFSLASFVYYKQASINNRNNGLQQKAILIQTSADIIFLSFLLFYSGGATNAFVSLLLIPIAIAAVTLTPLMLFFVALLAISSYSILLWFLPMSVMHGNMDGHFIGMGINFLFSTLVVAIVVGKMARNITKQQLAIAHYRENLLKQEQVTSLGVASAQVTHQLATPITTVQLLADELSDDFPNNEIIQDMQSQLARCRESLDDFRSMVFSIKEQTISVMSTRALLKDIQSNIEVNYPEITLQLKNTNPHDVTIMADAALMPAILNLINNAIRATKTNNSTALSITSELFDDNWQLIIRDYGKGFTLKKLNELGIRPVTSNQGLGMAVFLSHASLERIGGKLTLTNHVDGGALVTLSLPLSGNASPKGN